LARGLSRTQKRREFAAIFDGQIRAGNPERQRGLAPLLEMVPPRESANGEGGRQGRGVEGGRPAALNAHRVRVLHASSDLSLCRFGSRSLRREREGITLPPGGSCLFHPRLPPSPLPRGDRGSRIMPAKRYILLGLPPIYPGI